MNTSEINLGLNQEVELNISEVFESSENSKLWSDLCKAENKLAQLIINEFPLETMIVMGSNAWFLKLVSGKADLYYSSFSGSSWQDPVSRFDLELDFEFIISNDIQEIADHTSLIGEAIEAFQELPTVPMPDYFDFFVNE